MRKVGVSLPEAYVKGLEQLVKDGLYVNKAEAIRFAVKTLIQEEVGFNHSTLARMKWIEWVDRSKYAKKLKKAK